MDKKNFICEFMEKLEELNVSNEVVINAKDVLNYILEKYEIKQKSYELMACDYNKNESLIKLYLATKSQEGKSKKTIDRYEFVLSKLVNYYKDIQFEQYTKFHIRIFLDWYKSKNNKILSNTTLNGMIKIYRSFFNWLDDEDFIQKSPIKKISMLKDDTIKEDSLTNLQCVKMIESCSNLRDKALCQFLQDTGCRIDEVRKIKIEDMNFTERKVNVLGKGNKWREVYFTEVSKDYILNYINNRKINSEYLFTTLKNRKYDKSLDVSSLRNSIKRIGNKSNITHMHPHRYRVTFVTNSLNRGIPIQNVSKIVGHSKISTTMGYARIKEPRLKNDYDKVYN